MSPAHCCAVQMAFDRIVEQPTERSPTWDCKQARTCPWPGLTPAHSELTSVVQSRSEVNNPSCAPALPVPVSSNAAPSATVCTYNPVLMSMLPSVFDVHRPTLKHSSYPRISPPIRRRCTQKLSKSAD